MAANTVVANATCPRLAAPRGAPNERGTSSSGRPSITGPTPTTPVRDTGQTTSNRYRSQRQHWAKRPQRPRSWSIGHDRSAARHDPVRGKSATGRRRPRSTGSSPLRSPEARRHEDESDRRESDVAAARVHERRSSAASWAGSWLARCARRSSELRARELCHWCVRRHTARSAPKHAACRWFCLRRNTYRAYSA